MTWIRPKQMHWESTSGCSWSVKSQGLRTSVDAGWGGSCLAFPLFNANSDATPRPMASRVSIKAPKNQYNRWQFRFVGSSIVWERFLFFERCQRVEKDFCVEDSFTLKRRGLVNDFRRKSEALLSLGRWDFLFVEPPSSSCCLLHWWTLHHSIRAFATYN